MLIKTIITINDGFVTEVSNDLVEISKEEVLNTTIWYFKSSNEEILNEVTNDFMIKNKTPNPKRLGVLWCSRPGLGVNAKENA